MGRALAHLENLLELLACVGPARRVDFTRLRTGMQPFLQGLSAMIILLWDWDEARAGLCRAVEEQGARVRVIVVRDGPLSLKPDRDITVVSTQTHEGLIR
jgi:hypothetical protein